MALSGAYKICIHYFIMSKNINNYTAVDTVLESFKDFDNLLVALPSVIATIVVTSDRIPDQRKTIFSDIATGLLGSAIISSLIALSFNKMVVLKLVSQRRLTTQQLCISSGLIDASIAQLLGGVLAWTVDRYPVWITAFLGGEVFVLLLVTTLLSWKIDGSISDEQKQAALEDKPLCNIIV